jgi:HK97 gp10 family phage protein
MRLYAKATYTPRTTSGQFMEAVITPGARASVQAACQTIQQRAQALAPVDTGALRESIAVSIDDTGKTVVGTVGPNVDYAAYVEFGTGKAGASSPGAGAGPYNPNWPGMPAQPYMRPAFDETKPEILDLFRGNIASYLKA